MMDKSSRGATSLERWHSMSPMGSAAFHSHQELWQRTPCQHTRGHRLKIWFKSTHFEQFYVQRLHNPNMSLIHTVKKEFKHLTLERRTGCSCQALRKIARRWPFTKSCGCYFRWTTVRIPLERINSTLRSTLDARRSC